MQKKEDKKIFSEIINGRKDFPENSINFKVLYMLMDLENNSGTNYLHNLKNIPLSAFNEKAVAEMIILDEDSLKYIPDALNNKKVVKELLIENEDFYPKISEELKNDTLLLMEVSKENHLVTNYIKNKCFMKDVVCMDFIEKNFQNYFPLENNLSYENKIKAFDYLTEKKI